MPESLTYVLGMGEKKTRDPASTMVDGRDQLLTMSSVHTCTLTNMHTTHVHIHPCIPHHIHPGTHARTHHTHTNFLDT